MSDPERLLLLAVVDRAARDAIHGSTQATAEDVQSARRFFAAGDYDVAIEALGLPPHWLPTAIVEKAKDGTEST